MSPVEQAYRAACAAPLPAATAMHAGRVHYQHRTVTLALSPQRMDELFQHIGIQGIAEAGTRWLLDAALQHFWVGVLVLMRFSGLMTTGPIFGQSVVPFRARLLLILGLSCVLTPILATRTTVSLPQHTSQLVELVAAEFGLGFVLGLGVMTVLSGLQLAGQIIDQQIGLDAASVLNPDSGPTALTSNAFFLLGGIALLLMEPLNGHLLMLQTLTETFESQPVGQAALMSGLHELFTSLIHKSLLLGMQVCGPLLATMSLVTLSMGYLGHSVPQFNILVTGMPIRALVGVIILLLTLTGTSRVAIDAVPSALQQIQNAMQN